jgi:hypothetical protein
VAWKKIALPLDEGGLGIRDLSTWNITLLSKLLWNIQAKKDNLWVKWINVKYLRGKDIGKFPREMMIPPCGNGCLIYKRPSDWFRGLT